MLVTGQMAIIYKIFKGDEVLLRLLRGVPAQLVPQMPEGTLRRPEAQAEHGRVLPVHHSADGGGDQSSAGDQVIYNRYISYTYTNYSNEQ